MMMMMVMMTYDDQMSAPILRQRFVRRGREQLCGSRVVAGLECDQARRVQLHDQRHPEHQMHQLGVRQVLLSDHANRRGLLVVVFLFVFVSFLVLLPLFY